MIHNILNPLFLMGVIFSSCVYLYILNLSLDNMETMHIKGTTLTFVPSFGASVKLFSCVANVFVVVWVTIYGMCNLFKKGEKSVTSMVR